MRARAAPPRSCRLSSRYFDTSSLDSTAFVISSSINCPDDTDLGHRGFRWPSPWLPTSSAKAATMLICISRVASTCSASNRRRRGSSIGSREGSVPTTAGSVDLGQHHETRIERNPEHQGGQARADGVALGTGPQQAHPEERQQE